MIAKVILAGVLPHSIRIIITTDTNSVTEMAEAADSFASSGQLLKQAFTRSVCSPSFDMVQDTSQPDAEAEDEPEATLTFPLATQTYAGLCAAYRGPPRDHQRPQQRNPRPPAPNQQCQHPQPDQRAQKQWQLRTPRKPVHLRPEIRR